MKNANFMASLKAFFGKAWTATKAFSIKAGKWIIANKVISIPVAVVLVGGIACAIALPIALHEHKFSEEWTTDEVNHWHAATCSHEEEKADFGAHAYDNACDTTCNTCGATRTVGAHVYDNDCDTTCNDCGATRTVGAHAYDNACDTTCNTCGATRAITHDHADTLTAGDTTHYYLCSVCGDKKDEVAHVFDKSVASSEYLKAAATETTKAQYYKSCVCGAKSATEYFETDKAPANLQVADNSKTYDGTPVAEPTVTFDGVGAENFAYYKGNEKLTGRPTDAGTYRVVVTVDETDTHAGDRVEREFTIAKKAVNYLEITKVYNGKRGFGLNAGIYCQLGVENGVIAGDTVFLETSDDIEYNVGKYYFVRMYSTDDRDTVWLLGDDAANYDFQGNDVVGEITVTPKTINVTAEFEYSGSSVRQIHAPAPSLSDVIDGDEVYIEIAFDKADVDATVLTGEDAPCLDGADAGNYVLGAYSFSIVPAKLTLKEGEKIENTITYNGQKQHALSVSSNAFDGYVDAEAATLWLTATTPSKNAGEYTNDVILTPYVGNPAFGKVSHNYDFSEVAAKVTIKPLTVTLSSYVKVEYNGTSEFTLATPFDLTSANTGGGQDSVSDNDEVYITWIETSDADVTDETFAIDYTLGGADAGNYDIDELGVEIIKKKLTNLEINVSEAVYNVPGVDGSETATITLLVKDGIIPGDTVEITVTNYAELDLWSGTFELCLKDFEDLTQGQEIIALVASGDYANYELVADANGVVGILNIDAYNSFETAREFDCQADEIDAFTLGAGDKVYLKVMGGANSKLNDFEIFAPTGSAATFTLAVYDLDDTTTPKYVEEEALSDYYWDVCNTIDFYVVVTCVTSGGINVSAAK